MTDSMAATMFQLLQELSSVFSSVLHVEVMALRGLGKHRGDHQRSSHKACHPTFLEA